MQFRLIQLLAVMTVGAVALAALCNPESPIRYLFTSISLGLVVLSVPLAVACSTTNRMFWIGFAICSSSYLLITFRQSKNDSDNYYRGDEDLVTSIIAIRTYEAIYGKGLVNQFPPNPNGGGVFSMPSNATMAARPIPQMMTPGGPRSWSRQSQFLCTFHYIWSLLFGWLGGHITKWTYRREKRCQEPKTLS